MYIKQCFWKEKREFIILYYENTKVIIWVLIVKCMAID